MLVAGGYKDESLVAVDFAAVFAGLDEYRGTPFVEQPERCGGVQPGSSAPGSAGATGSSAPGSAGATGGAGPATGAAAPRFACLTHLPVRSLFVARCSLKAAHRATQAQVEAKGLPRVLDLHQPVLSKGQVGGLGGGTGCDGGGGGWTGLELELRGREVQRGSASGLSSFRDMALCRDADALCCAA